MTPNLRKLGIDVGSMSVKVVLTDPECTDVIYQEYRPHRGEQAGTLFDVLIEMDARFRIFEDVRVSITGSGGTALAPALNAEFVQEVNAFAAAIERSHPAVRTAIDIGGQDAKMVIWEGDPTKPHTKRFVNMNDKCAGGTGATLDRVVRKLGMNDASLRGLKYLPIHVHPVASRCGIFAETDINSLVKQGVPVEECMTSLCHAIVHQNLGSLARGRLVAAKVLLLGGPHKYCPALHEAWQHQLAAHWGMPPSEAEPLVEVPVDGLYFAARGSIYESRFRPLGSVAAGVLPVLRSRSEFARVGDAQVLLQVRGLAGTDFCPAEFRKRHGYTSLGVGPGSDELVSADVFIGLDAGSTSTKGVVVNDSGRVLASAYQLAEGTPIDDAKRVLKELGRKLGEVIPKANVRSFTVTGYAREYLRKTLGADCSVVETVAHVEGARQLALDTDVILDVGGQDIKVLFLADGAVSDFRLNTQCSAGNGFYLQSAAARFGIPIEKYAECAFGARRMPPFKTGCAVFLESDIVTFQQQGWTPTEILAGLAHAVPRNVWEYVVQETNLERRGRSFLLQGGTHRNLAVVKAQVDYIRERVPHATIRVHPFTAEAGAIGAALLGRKQWRTRQGPQTSAFLGFDDLQRVHCSVRRDETTRCSHCDNRCLRTVIRAKVGEGSERVFMLAACDKGMTDDKDEVRALTRQQTEQARTRPNYVHEHDVRVFSAGLEQPKPPDTPRSLPRWLPVRRRSNSARPLRIGLPRVLNMWRYAPFFSSYLKGVVPGPVSLRWSSRTTHAQWLAGGHHNRAELCFPGKYGVAHVHELLGSGLDVIVNPAIVSMDSSCSNTVNASACPVAMASPDLVKAAFTSGEDLFVKAGVRYLRPVLHMDDEALLDRELYAFAHTAFGAARKRHEAALSSAWGSYRSFYAQLQGKARQTLQRLISVGEVGVLFLGRPYHYDSGVNHGVPAALQRRGYPVFTSESLPRDPETMAALFGAEVAAGQLSSCFAIDDVWKHSLVESTNRKIWSAKFAARIPNLAIVDFVSFRCGLDAVVLHIVEGIARCAGTPYFTLHDMDQNKPTGSLEIRIDTIDYYLQQYQRELKTGRVPADAIQTMTPDLRSMFVE